MQQLQICFEDLKRLICRPWGPEEEAAAGVADGGTRGSAGPSSGAHFCMPTWGHVVALQSSCLTVCNGRAEHVIMCPKMGT
jgi:hypothetical protein